MKQKFIFILLLCIPLFIYWNNFHDNFVGPDNIVQVYENAHVKNFNFKNTKALFTSSVVNMYQPFTSFVFSIIVSIFGVESAKAFLIFSFLIHLINLFLVYFIGLKLLKNNIKAMFLSLLFSIHPLAIESVAWVSATSTVLFSFFFLLALLCYIKHIENSNNKYYFLSLLFFLIGSFCKVQIISFVGVLFLVDYLYKRPFLSKKYLIQKIPFLLVGIVFGIIALQFRNHEVINTTPLSYSKFYFAVNQFVWYIIKLFIPINSAIVYSWPKELTSLNHIYVF